MRWVDGIIESPDMSLSKLRDIVKDREGWCAATSVLLPGKFHRQRSLAGYSPWGCKESDMTELTAHTQRVEVRLNGGQNFLLFSQFGPCSLPIGRAVFCRAHISPSQPHKNRGCLITEFWKNRGPAEGKTDMLLASEG